MNWKRHWTTRCLECNIALGLTDPTIQHVCRGWDESMKHEPLRCEVRCTETGQVVLVGESLESTRRRIPERPAIDPRENTR